MMAVVQQSVSARLAPPAVQPSVAYPNFFSGQTFRIVAPDTTLGRTLRIISVIRRNGTTMIGHTINGTGCTCLPIEQFCRAYPNRAPIAN